MLRRSLTRVMTTIAIASALAVAAHTMAPIAHADCDGGFTYETAVAHARGAIVGVIAETQQDEIGFVYASAVTVERAIGVRVGQIFHGRVDTGLCSSDFARVGAHVVVLLGVTFPNVPGGPSDVFYTIGQTVTAAEVASLARDLPDTAMASAAELSSDPGSPLPPMMIVGFALVVLLGYGSLRRRTGA